MSVKKISLTVRMVGETFEVTWTVVDDATSQPIQGATITCSGTSVATNASGQGVISGFKDGTYPFTITHPNYDTYTGSFTCA